MKNKKIMTIAAHPDDEILGCGATVAKLIKQGNKAYTVILSDGVTSRKTWGKDELKRRESDMYKANKTIGIDKENVTIFDFPDNKFDSVPLLDIIKKIREKIIEIKPDVIFTHYKNDLNIDHKLTYQATITATRPMKGETVKIIYSFEVLSSTEWNYPLSFSPNVFFDVTDTIRLKLKAMECYKEELRDEEHPRSLNAIEINSRLWGIKSAMRYSEAFVLVRDNI